jgi:hypothetical protein
MKKQEEAAAFTWHRLISKIGRNRLEIAATALLGLATICSAHCTH